MVRLTDFYQLMRDEFGGPRADAILTDHVVLALGGRTGAQAIEAGLDPKLVWRSLCAEFDVPATRW